LRTLTSFLLTTTMRFLVLVDALVVLVVTLVQVLVLVLVLKTLLLRPLLGMDASVRNGTSGW
jgi:hypothetical protein